MKKILLTCLLLISCTPIPWYEGYYAAVDRSTGCENFPILDPDGSFSINQNILTITANTNVRGGLYMGVIAAKEYPRTDGTFILTGEFRKSGGTPEQIDANIQWVDENYTEHRAEILWSLNPFSPLYGWVWTRGTTNEEILLFELGDDANWHTFEVVSYHSGDIHILRSISIDGHKFDLNIPQGTLEKTYNDQLTVLLEVQNQYPACDASIATMGQAEFRNVTLQNEDT